MKSVSLRSCAAFLIAVLFCGLFSGCGGKNGNSVNTGLPAGRYDMIIDSADDIKCDYLLVYHSAATYSEIDACIDLLEQLSHSSDNTYQICPDSLLVEDSNQKMILLGATTYSESTVSDSIMDDIRANNYYDYLLRSYDNRLCISWVSKFGRDDAFQYLLGTILPSGLDSVYNTDYSRLYLSDRSDSPVVTIDDVNILQYSIIIPSAASLVEKSSAESLAETIESATGVKIPVYPDSTETSTYEILVGDTNRGETYVTSFFAVNRYAIAQYGTKLILRGGQIDASSTAVSVFSGMIDHALVTAEPLHIKAGYCKTGTADVATLGALDGYKLIYSDEFDGKEPNEAIWSPVDSFVSAYGLGSGFTFYNAKNISMTGDALRLTTYCGSDGYVAARADTFDKFSFKYGYLEVRAKFNVASGYWVQMMLTDTDAKLDTVSQIDVFNSMKDNTTIFSSSGIWGSEDYYNDYLKMYDKTYENFRSYKLPDNKVFYDDEYHTYGIEWTESYIRYYIDGESYGTVEITDGKYKDLKKEMYIMFITNVSMTEDFVDDEQANWPTYYDIDWIRLYQRDGGTYTLGEYPEKIKGEELRKEKEKKLAEEATKAAKEAEKK